MRTLLPFAAHAAWADLSGGSVQKGGFANHFYSPKNSLLGRAMPDRLTPRAYGGHSVMPQCCFLGRVSKRAILLASTLSAL